MDAVRFGRQVRIVRQRRGWRQTDLARRARCSPAAISRVERGQSGGLSVAALDCIALALGASLDVRLYLPGGELDRLLDSGHASLVDQAVALLAGMG
jgi:transcriptional regulator with XRE-family HTH domain